MSPSSSNGCEDCVRIIGAGKGVEPAPCLRRHVVGAGSVVRAGAVVKQRSRFGDGVVIDGFPAAEVGRIEEPGLPAWALHIDDLPSPTARR